MKILIGLFTCLLMLPSFASEPRCDDEAKAAANKFMEIYNLDLDSLKFYSGTKSDIIKDFQLDHEDYEGNYSPSNYSKDAEVWILRSSAWGGTGEEAISLNPSTCELLGVDNIWSE